MRSGIHESFKNCVCVYQVRVCMHTQFSLHFERDSNGREGTAKCGCWIGSSLITAIQKVSRIHWCYMVNVFLWVFYYFPLLARSIYIRFHASWWDHACLEHAEIGYSSACSIFRFVGWLFVCAQSHGSTPISQLRDSTFQNGSFQLSFTCQTTHCSSRTLPDDWLEILATWHMVLKMRSAPISTFADLWHSFLHQCHSLAI